MKRTAAIAIIALGLLGACSTETETEAPQATSALEYTLQNGEKVSYERVGETPAEMTADIQARFDAVLIEPDVAAYEAALATEEGPGADTDNFAAFKALANEVGAETGKYVGGVIPAIQTCDDENVVSWGFAAQTASLMTFADCDAEDSKAAAQELAAQYLETAMGGSGSWVLIEQNSAN